MEDIFDAFDRDMSGMIDLTEFCSEKPHNSQATMAAQFSGAAQGTVVARSARPEDAGF